LLPQIVYYCKGGKTKITKWKTGVRGIESTLLPHSLLQHKQQQ